jgi:hypothetical protein
MASWGETSLLDYSLEREGGHDEPWDFCNLDEDPLLALRGGQKIRIKAACSTAGIALWADLIRVDLLCREGNFLRKASGTAQGTIQAPSWPVRQSLLRKGAEVWKVRAIRAAPVANLFFGRVR